MLGKISVKACLCRSSVQILNFSLSTSAFLRQYTFQTQFASSPLLNLSLCLSSTPPFTPTFGRRVAHLNPGGMRSTPAPPRGPGPAPPARVEPCAHPLMAKHRPPHRGGRATPSAHIRGRNSILRPPANTATCPQRSEDPRRIPTFLLWARVQHPAFREER